jgi:signal transduction histidine kinase
MAAGLTLGALVVTLSVLSSAGLATAGLATVTGLRSAALVLAVVVACTSHLVWRATGVARGCRVSTGAWLLAGVSVLDLAEGLSPAAGASATLRLTLSVCAAVWIAWAYVGPDIDTSTRQPRDLVAALTAALVAWGGLTLLPGALGLPDVASTGSSHLVVGLVWAVAAAIGLTRAVDRASVLLGWVAWLAVALAVAELARFTAAVDSAAWLTTAGGIRASGLLLAAIGGTTCLSRLVTARRTALHLERLDHAEDARRHHVGERERAHEIRNALLAIEGASLTLERYDDQLSPEDRARLADAMLDGFEHLRQLLAPATTTSPASTASLDVVVGRRVALAQRRGLPVRLTSDLDVRVDCPAVAITQILDNLFANAVKYGDAVRSGVEIDVVADDDHATVHLRDHGPGIPSEDHERLFRRGVRLSRRGDGEGLGLPIARELARARGGDLAITSPPAGGAGFVLTLPRAARVAPAGGAHEVEDRSQVGERHLSPVLGEPGDPSPAGGGPIVERDHDVRLHRHRPGTDDHDIGPGAVRGSEVQHDLDLTFQQRAQALGQQDRSRRQGDTRAGSLSGHTPM